MFLLVALLAGQGLAQADKFGQSSERMASGKADQAEGARILADFRRAGIAGDYWLKFELRVMPRRGAERTVSGTIFGMRGPSGPISRVNVGAQHWLIESGPSPGAWTNWAGNTDLAREAAAGDSLADTGVTIFDLQMPFLYWTDFTYEGEARVRGRPTHSFILRPEAGYVPPFVGMSGVRVLIDIQFQAMVQAELLGVNNAVEKSIVMLDLKKVGEQWLVKTIDVKNARTRDKTRLSITQAALGLSLPVATFSRDNLLADPPAIPVRAVVKF